VTSTQSDLDRVLVAERELWQDGPPHDLFRRLRAQCPVHWTASIDAYPGEAGFWSVTRAQDIQTVSRDWRTYSSELGGVTATTDVLPLELARAMFIGMDPPKHDRLKMLFQAGFTPRRIAAHEPAILVDVLDRLRAPGGVRPGHRCRAARGLARDRELSSASRPRTTAPGPT
jgi:cytochrome P450